MVINPNNLANRSTRKIRKEQVYCVSSSESFGNVTTLTILASALTEFKFNHCLWLWFPLKLYNGGLGLRLNDNSDIKL